MITNFEEWTPGFNPKHQPVVLWLEEFFSGTKGNRIPTKSSPVTGPKLCKAIKARLGFKSFSEAQLRTCVVEVRKRGIICLGSGGKGYYLVETNEELDLQIKSLEERAVATKYSAEALKRFDRSKLTGGLFERLFE